MFKVPQAEQINFDVNQIEVLNDYWSESNFTYDNNLSVSKNNKVFLDGLCVKIQPLSSIDENGYSTIKVSVAGDSSAEFEIINNDLDPLVNELKRSVMDFEKEDEDPYFFGGDELLEFLLKHKTIVELKNILSKV